MSQVLLRGVSKAYGPTLAVDGVDLELPEGVITTLLGPSGCGKSTTLRLVAGFEMPDAGEVVIGGRVVASAGVFVPPERRRVGMVFQQLALFPHLDVAGNIAYGLRHLDRAARRRRVAELLDLVDMPGMDARYPNQLSGGEAQRVAVARALAPGPGVVLLDEPFSSLDVALRAGLRAEIRRILRAARVTTLLVTHDQDEALSMGDRVAIMFEGRLAQVGTPEQVYRSPATARAAAFLGDANAVRGTLSGGRVRTVLGDFAAEGDDGPVTVLVRPEDLDLVADDTGPAQVTEVDYFGHDQLIVLRLGDQWVRARLHARRQLAPGTTVRVDAHPDEPVVVFPGRAALSG